jgi:chemotaxis protein MotB
MLLVIIFLLSVFMLAQFFLSREVTGKDTALAVSTARSRS